MIYREYALPAEARDAALCAWRFAVEPHEPEAIEHVIVPDGTASITLAIGPAGERFAGCAGPSRTAHSLIVRHGWSYVGLRLRAGVAPALLGMGAAALVGAMLPLDGGGRRVAAIVDALSSFAREREITRALERRFGHALAELACPDLLVARVADRLIASKGALPIAELARDAGLSERQLRRRFAAHTGLAPKRFASIQRLRHAMILAVADKQRPWSDVAHEAGFADQAHLNRDSTAAFDRPPGGIGAHIGRIDHVFAGRFVQDERARSR